MIASDEPCVRAPVVSPGAWNRSASMRMQRCSISAVCGYSAWSMKLRCRFSAMIRCASGSIHVVTNVARLRCGIPSRTSSSPISRIASTDAHAVLGQLVVGRGLEQEAVAVVARERLEPLGERGAGGFELGHAGWRDRGGRYRHGRSSSG